MTGSKRIGILGVAVAGLLTLGACGSTPTVLPATNSTEHTSALQVWGNDYIQCGNVPLDHC
jgi:hypothetical protein